MILNQQKSKVFGIMLLLIFLFSFIAPISVYAGDDDSKDEYVSYSTCGAESAIKAAIQEANTKLKYDTKSTSDSDSQGDVKTALFVNIKGQPKELALVDDDFFKVNKTNWNLAKDKDISKSMKYFVQALNEKGDKDAVKEFMDGFQSGDNSISQVMLTMAFGDTRADLYQAYRIIEPALNLLNVVLGIGCVLLILLLLFSTVMDLAYIGLPVWREAQSKDGSKHPFGVSFEAIKTVEEVEKGVGGGDAGYRNAYLLYFKRRALTYIILAICIMYLICGGIAGIIGFVLRLVGGIV